MGKKENPLIFLILFSREEMSEKWKRTSEVLIYLFPVGCILSVFLPPAHVRVADGEGPDGLASFPRGARYWECMDHERALCS